MNKTIKNLLKYLLISQRFIMGATTILFSILVFIQVIIRYFFNFPLYGVEEIAVYSAVWLYFIGSGYGVYRENHISANIMDFILSSKKSKDIFKFISSFITFFLICWVFYLCFKYFQWSVNRQPKSPELRIPLFYIHAAMIFGIGIMGFCGFSCCGSGLR